MSKLLCFTAMLHFVTIFLDHVSAKYDLNWFTVGKVITKIKRVNFFIETQCSSITHELLCYGYGIRCGIGLRTTAVVLNLFGP